MLQTMVVRAARVLSLLAATLALNVQAGNDTIEQAVLAEASRNWDAARNADLDGMLAPLLPTDKGAYLLQGHVFWSRAETVADFQVAFQGVARQDIEWEREAVTVLSPSSALYVAAGVYRQYDTAGELLLESPHAVSLVYVLVGDRWRIRHLHQSFPGVVPD